LGVKVAVYVTQAARTARDVEMLVYAHGLDLCKPVFGNRPATFISDAPFKLGALAEASGRPIVVMVPFLDWERLAANSMAYGRKWHRIAQPETFNRVAAEALEQVRAITNNTPALQRLILAGHSRAYGFFDALAHEHASPHMRTGALSRPTHVWALDTTYSAPIADWRAWLRSRDDLTATVVFREGRYQTKGSTVVKELATGIRGREFAKLAGASNGRLTVIPVPANKVSHCAIPATYLPRLLATLPALTRSQEDFDANESYEALAERDLAELETEAEASGYEDETFAEDESENEDTPQRFDAFGDERDSEWGAESSEELLQSPDQNEAPMSFALDTEDESSLSGSGLSPAEQKAVEITSQFETGKRGGFYGLSGNFDGQGLSFGLVNWTIGTGSLQPLLRDFAKEHPARWISVFGADASRFLQLIARKDKVAQAEQHRFAVQEMNSVSTNARGRKIWTVRQPWVGYFRKLSEDVAFQRIQVRYVRDLLARADYYCRQFKLRSERSFCFMFDAVASHGKWWLVKKFARVEKRRVLVEQALKTLAARFGAGRIPESEVLLAIADVLATTSAQRWADNVRQRKRWFVTGQHPRKRELAGLDPSADVPYTTSKSTADKEALEEAGDLETESPSRDEMIAALDGELRDGKWQMVALRLNGFGGNDIQRMIARMKLEQILQTRQAVVEFLANWPRQAEILAALDAAARARRQPARSRPPSSTVWAAYQQVKYGRLDKYQVWELIGGSVGKTLTGKDSCAARVSWSLNHSGFPIRGRVDFINSPKVTFNGKPGDGMSYNVNTSTLASFLTATLGPPDAVIRTRADAEALEAGLGTGKIAIMVSRQHAGILKAGYREDPLWHNDSLGPFQVWKLP